MARKDGTKMGREHIPDIPKRPAGRVIAEDEYPREDGAVNDASSQEQTESQKVTGYFESAPGVKSSGRLHNHMAILAGYFLIAAGVAIIFLCLTVVKKPPEFTSTAIALMLPLGAGLVGGGVANKSLQARIENGHGA